MISRTVKLALFDVQSTKHIPMHITTYLHVIILALCIGPAVYFREPCKSMLHLKTIGVSGTLLVAASELGGGFGKES